MWTQLQCLDRNLSKATLKSERWQPSATTQQAPFRAQQTEKLSCQSNVVFWKHVIYSLIRWSTTNQCVWVRKDTMMQFSSLSKVSWIATDWSIVLTFKLAGRQLWDHALQTKTHSVETRGAQLFLSEVEAQRNNRERSSSAESHIIPFRPRSFSSFPPSFAAGSARPSLPRTDSGSRCTPSVTSLCLVCKGLKLLTHGRLCLATPRTPQKVYESFLRKCWWPPVNQAEVVFWNPSIASFFPPNILYWIYILLVSKWTTVLLLLILFDFYGSWRVKI